VLESFIILAHGGKLKYRRNIPKNQLEMLVREKHSSLLQKFVNYAGKKFYRIGPNCDRTEVTQKL
jgi:hypothetical protein